MWWKKAKSNQSAKEAEGKATAQAKPTEPPEADLPAQVPAQTKWGGRLVRCGWLLVGLLWVLPSLLLAAAGSWWLWQEGWLWPWLGLTGAVSLVGWLLAQWLRQSSRDTWGVLVRPDPRWTPQDQAAWEKVERLAARLQQSNLPLDQPEALLQAFYEVLATVAQHYRPESDRPELEIPAPHVLRIVERVAADLRRTLLERAPGSHWLTLHDFYKLSRLAAWFQRFYRWFYGAYRVSQLATNPAAALVREVRDAALGQVQTSTTEELKEGVISFCVRQTGRYAIQLYSGKVMLEEESDRLPPSRDARRQLQQAAQTAPGEEEPLRLLVLGGTGVGKGLLMEIFGGLAAPGKQSLWKKLFSSPPISRRVWHAEDLPPLLVTDWPEYDPTTPPPDRLAPFDKEALQTDLVLLVCSETPARWPTDRQWLDRLRAVYQQHPERNPPAVMAVILGGEEGASEKAAIEESWEKASVNDAPAPGLSDRSLLCQLRQGLGFTEKEPVLILWPDPGQQTEIREKIIEAIRQVAPEAERARYARYYADYHRQERWPRLWRQLRQAGPPVGKLLAEQTPNLLKQASKSLWQKGTRWFRRKQ